MPGGGGEAAVFGDGNDHTHCLKSVHSGLHYSEIWSEYVRSSAFIQGGKGFSILTSHLPSTCHAPRLQHETVLSPLVRSLAPCTSVPLPDRRRAFAGACGPGQSRTQGRSVSETQPVRSVAGARGRRCLGQRFQCDSGVSGEDIWQDRLAAGSAIARCSGAALVIGGGGADCFWSCSGTADQCVWRTAQCPGSDPPCPRDSEVDRRPIDSRQLA